MTRTQASSSSRTLGRTALAITPESEPEAEVERAVGQDVNDDEDTDVGEPARARASGSRHPSVLTRTSATTSNTSTTTTAVTSTRLLPLRRPLGIASLLARERNGGADAEQRPSSPERPDRRTQTSTQQTRARPKLASRAGTTRAASPTASSVSAGVVSRYSEPVSRLSTVTGGVGRDTGGSELWRELRGMQLRPEDAISGCNGEIMITGVLCTMCRVV